MPIRTLSRTVTFTQPFHLAGIDHAIPAGDYRVDTDEETLDGLSFLAWRRVATFIHLTVNGAVETHRVDPLDLDASLELDAPRS